jgi:hypothetical protein
MKKGRVIAVSSIVLLLAAGVLMMGHLGGCRQNCFKSGGFCPGFRDRGFPSKCMGKDFKELVLSRIDGCVEDLNLSVDQKEKYRVMRQNLKENLMQGLERRKKLFLEVRKEIRREDPDMDAVAGLIKGGLAEMPSQLEKNLDLFVSFYKMLNKGQRDALLKKFRERTNCGDA